MYAMLGTRSNLCYAVGVLGRHAARPDNLHWAAVIRVFAYSKGTPKLGLGRLSLDVALDYRLHLCPRIWRRLLVLKLEPRVTASSTKAEYLGLSRASKEAIHLPQLLSELAQGSRGPIEVFGDDQGANTLSRDAQFHDCTCHLRLTEHFVREQVQQGDISVPYSPTARMVANIMTKSLPVPAFVQHRLTLGIRPFQARGSVAADALPSG
ncbi:hypothetical protein JCM10908_002212 [Rhodotorula pacifica]|uniref:Ty1/Copia family ribonuclease HI n=1 Tax=Rhodotorula pacifica TaxID=1495444 RepID=UPI00316B9C88